MHESYTVCRLSICRVQHQLLRIVEGSVQAEGRLQATRARLVSGLCAGTVTTVETYAAKERNRAFQLAQNGMAKKVMEELGLWEL
jgi:hypothetical protein